MRIFRVASGLSLLLSAAFWAKLIEYATGYTQILGLVAVTTLVGFFGGMIFLSGVTKK